MTNGERLIAVGACCEAIEWADKYKTPKAAWMACKNGSWMLWLCGRVAGLPDSDSRRKLVLVAAECAELALPFVRDEEMRAICESTIQTCYAYAWGEAELDDMRSAARAAYDASNAAYDAAYAYDASNAAYAGHAAYAAARAASDAGRAAYAAARAASDAASNAAYDASSDASYAASDAAARSKMMAACAEIVRANYPESPL